MRTALPDLAVDLKTTDRTLRRAVQQGLIRASRPSPRKLELPTSERAYLVRNWGLLSELREALRTEPAVSLGVLFGSRARGDQRHDSDVDLLVDLRRGSDARALAARLSRKLGLRFHVVTLDETRRTPILFAEIVRDGRTLVDRDEVWPRIRRQRRSIARAASEERRSIEERFDAVFDLDRAA